jgi:Cu(I)/Ag(I) efflux system membrane fusion protein
MKPMLILWFAVATILAAGAGWLVGNRSIAPRGVASQTGGRRIQFYQDSMHPWIKSDKPGKCTICGMDLTPVYEGEPGMAGGEGLIILSESNINVADVRATPVRRQPVRRTLRLAGEISATDERRVFVSARADGQIEKLFHENLLGQMKVNTPLAVLSSKAVAEVERELISLERGDGIEKLPGGEQQRQRLLSAARARLAQFGFSEDQIKAMPGRSEFDTGMEVRMPIDGTVVSRQVYEGMAVKEGQRMFEVVDFSTVWFKFDCYESDMAWIAPNLEVEVTTPSAPGKTFKARITYLEPSIGHMVRSIKGRSELENPVITENGRERRLLREREYAEGVISVEAASGLSVPRTAVLSPGAEPMVYVEKGTGTYERRFVTLGRVGDEFVEVLSGLAEGESVVTRGNLLIDSQAQINQSGSPTTPADAAEKGVLITRVTDDQRFKASEMFGIAVSMASALSRDNLDQFNQQVASLQNALLPFHHTFADEAVLKKQLAKLEVVAHLQPAADLAAARKAFLAFSNALVDFAKVVRQVEAFSYLRIYHCSMAADAVPGGPKDGFWLQAGPPLRNPFFGAAMIECGVEVNVSNVVESPNKANPPAAQIAPKRGLLPAPPTTPSSSLPERYP